MTRGTGSLEPDRNPGHRTVPIGEVLVHRQNFPPRRLVSRVTEMGGITECGLRVGPCDASQRLQTTTAVLRYQPPAKIGILLICDEKDRERDAVDLVSIGFVSYCRRVL
jgi:hypothetical protein